MLEEITNTQIDLGKEVQTKHLNEFMVKLKNSGYTSHYRNRFWTVHSKQLRKWSRLTNQEKSPCTGTKIGKRKTERNRKKATN
jgi:hypothetical protein